MHNKNVTEELKHLIPKNSLGLRYELEETSGSKLMLVVYRGSYFLGLTHIWHVWSWSTLKTHTVSSVRPRHINRAIKRLQNRGVIRAS